MPWWEEITFSAGRPCGSSPSNGGEEHLTAIQVPPPPENYGTTRQLFDRIFDFVAQHPGLEEESARKLAYFTLAALFPECAPILPMVSIVASQGAAATMLLHMLECVFLQPIHVGELTLAQLMSLPNPLSHVLLIDQTAVSKQLERALGVMSRPGAGIISKGKVRKVFCPVIACTAEPIRDARLSDLAMHVVLVPSQSRLPKFDQQSAEATSREIRPYLQQYRQNNLEAVRDSQFEAPEFSSPTNEIAAMLGRSIVGDSDLQARVIPLLRDQDRESRLRRTDSLQAVIVEAGLFLSHEGRRGQARVGEFTDVAEAILKGRGEVIKLEPRAVGDILRSMGLFSQRLGSAGRGIRFGNGIRRKFHDLARAFDVRSLHENGVRCEFCERARAGLGDPPGQEKS